MRIRHGLLACLTLSVAVSCASTADTAKTDASTDGAAPRVTRGTACPTEGAQATGEAPLCTDVRKYVLCTCLGGKWDCGHCPTCPATIRLADTGQLCGFGTACEGPTLALRCDGSSVTVTGTCRCVWDSPWTCDGVLDTPCDAGAGDAAGE